VGFVAAAPLSRGREKSFKAQVAGAWVPLLGRSGRRCCAEAAWQRRRKYKVVDAVQQQALASSNSSGGTAA